MAKLDLYFKDGQGNHSSARLMAWYFMWFFFLFNCLFALIVFFLTKVSVANTDVLQMVIMYILALDVLILIAIFAPKQFAKISEVRQVIELAKATGTDPSVKQ